MYRMSLGFSAEKIHNCLGLLALCCFAFAKLSIKFDLYVTVLPTVANVMEILRSECCRSVHGSPVYSQHTTPETQLSLTGTLYGSQ